MSRTSLSPLRGRSRGPSLAIMDKKSDASVGFGPLKIAAFVGSARKESYNRKLFNNVVRLAPPGMVITELSGWTDWPLYDQDVPYDEFPPGVVENGAAIDASDAVLFVSPEYNYSIPGGLKNGIDWISRTTPQPFAGKAASIMGASTGLIGTARMQYHLRQVLVFLEAVPTNKPEIMVGRAGDAFDEQGMLTNPITEELITAQLTALAAHAHAQAAIHSASPGR